MPEFYPVSFERHGQKQLMPLSSWECVADQQMAALIPTEFVMAARFYPIVFVREQEKVGAFALLGFQPGKNLMLDARRQWVANYIPAVFRRIPFSVAPLKDRKEEYVLCVDEASGQIVDKGGIPLFDKDGKRSEFLEKTLKFTMDCFRQHRAGEVFCSLLNELELLSPLQINMKEGEKNVRLEGLLRIDEKKMNALPDEDFLRLRKAGVFALIYAHLLSLVNMRTLGDRMQDIQKQTAAPAAQVPLPDSFKF